MLARVLWYAVAVRCKAVACTCWREFYGRCELAQLVSNTDFSTAVNTRTIDKLSGSRCSAVFWVVAENREARLWSSVVSPAARRSKIGCFSEYGQVKSTFWVQAVRQLRFMSTSLILRCVQATRLHIEKADAWLVVCNAKAGTHLCARENIML